MLGRNKDPEGEGRKKQDAGRSEVVLTDSECGRSPAPSGLTALRPLVLESGRPASPRGGLGVRGHTPASPGKSAAFGTAVRHRFSSASDCPRPSPCAQSHVTGQPVGRLPSRSVAASGTACNEQGGRVGHAASDAAVVDGTAPRDSGRLGTGLPPSLALPCPVFWGKDGFP